MKTGTSIPTRLAQIEVIPGRPRVNADKMLAAIHAARRDGIELVLFPEMAIPGYLLGDEWEHDAFVRQCEACGRDILAATHGMTVVFGNVGVDWSRRNEDGRVRKYNALFVAEDGHFIGPDTSPYDFTIKTLMPNYRQFDDSRHFFDLRKLAFEEQKDVATLMGPVHSRRATLGCILCEDAWDMDYAVSPLGILSQDDRIDLFINASASPFTLNKNNKRNRVFCAHAKRLGRPLVYINNVGIQNNGKTVFCFDGASSVYDAKGHHLRCGEAFEETTLTVDLPLERGATIGNRSELETDTCGDMIKAITYGTTRFMQSCGISRVVVGVSGGIDSALVAAIYSQILPPDQLLLVNMPSQFNSETTISLARELSDQAGCFFASVPIEESVAVSRRQLDGLRIVRANGAEENLTLSNFVLENIQARDRSARVLAAIAAAFGGVFTCNANKSEMTVGYTTLYGDLGGYLANIGDLWKTQVYELAEYVNRVILGRDLIPQGTIDIVPSAELSHAQNVDEGKGDPMIYPYHDKLFKSWVEWWNRATPEETLSAYAAGTLDELLEYDGRIRDLFVDDAAFIADLERWWNLYQGMGVAKRIQAPPVLAIKRRAFGFDHRESQMGPLYTDEYQRLKTKLLASNQ